MKAIYKPIPADKSKLLNVICQEGKKEFDYPWHYHQEYELTYILKGRGLRFVGNSVENFQDDDLVLIGPNIPHCWINESNHYKQSTNAIVIYLKKDFFNESWLQSYEFKDIKKLFELSEKGIKFNHTETMKLKEKCFELPKLPPLQKLILMIQILKDLSESSGYGLLCEQKIAYNFDQSHRERLDVIYNYINEHYREKITLEDIAKQVHMSPKYFCRFFSRVMKKPFFEFLNENRISRSCQLLIETDKSISQICYDSGFESIPFFYRQFKRFKQCQPRQYRLRYLSASSQES